MIQWILAELSGMLKGRERNNGESNFSSVLKAIPDFLHETEQELPNFQRGLLLVVFLLFCLLDSNTKE